MNASTLPVGHSASRGANRAAFLILALVASFITLPAQRAEAAGFRATLAANYAKAYAYSYNSNYANYNNKGGDCTNFVSQSWYAGDVSMDTTGGDKWYYKTARSGSSYLPYPTPSWIRVKDFRSYWYNNGSSYKYIQGETALTYKYSPSGLGEVYIFDSGDSSSKASWFHAAINVGWSKGYDEYAQHSVGRITKWTYMFSTRTSAQRKNILKPGRGYRSIAP
ncbi:amidase domain-containing protein [Micromonospora sp. bgisy143]|uniref:amidase domain-containing protein n=1 Tax=Micromonospora sp. bgisy143 TaxID=3413790 RepID=UPI003EBFD960